MNTIKWAICDDVSFVCESIELALKKYDELEHVGSAYSAEECKTVCAEKKPDIILLDIQMNTENEGLLLIPTLKQISPSTKIIMLTSHTDDELVFKAFSLGANNYISKSSPTEDIYTAIKNLHNGQCTIDGNIMQSLLSQTKKVAHHQQSLLYIVSLMSTLSRSEFEILRSAYDGLSYRQIAQERFVELGTIKKQVSRILRKFNANNMKELIEILTETNVFDIYE